MEIVLAVGCGVAIGWIGCQLLVVKDMIRQIIQMRAAGFDPVLAADKNKKPEPSIEVNET